MDANEKPSGKIPDLLHIYIYPGPSIDTVTHNPKTECLVTASMGGGALDAQTITVTKIIANSWK